MARFESIAPCRLCLFGEHQDYLNLPAIAMALPLFCKITGEEHEGKFIDLHVPFLGKTFHYDLDNLPDKQTPSTEKPDFALAAIHEALQDGWMFTKGANCTSTVQMPMAAGCSTSSAFCVAWVQVLARLADRAFSSALEIAQRAHAAEVLHFNAPGGTMDHITSAVGGLLRIGPGMWDFESIPDNRHTWILAYSGEPKDTLAHLNRCKRQRLAIFDKIGRNWDEEGPLKDSLSDEEKALLYATRINRDTEQKAFNLLSRGGNGQQLGGLMLEHHKALRDGLYLSTDKIEKINRAAMGAGAWGVKIVGSGGGGCTVAWCPSERISPILAAMKDAGASETWVIDRLTKGASINSLYH